MQFVHHGEYPGKSSVTFLPMINMNPSDATCVYSTLKFITNHAIQHNITPIITFDQPLWFKALSIIITAEPEGSDLHKTILRLGVFHTEMSLLGCIGHIMSGSGLEQVLESIYASNAVVHILTGKVVSCAVQAHLIVDASLNALLLADSLDMTLCPILQKEDALQEQEPFDLHEEIANGDTSIIQEANSVYKKLMNESTTLEEVCKSPVIEEISSLLKQKTDFLASSKTAQLWLQYMDMINILRKYIRAERTGNGELHLQAVSEMLPYMAASGHNNYTKCIWILKK